MANRQINVAWGPTDIRTGAAVYTHTATVSGFVQIQVFISDAAGSGDYVYYIRKQRAGAGVNYVMGPKTTSTHAAGETGIGAETILTYCHVGDVVQIYVDGLAGDIACNGFIEIVEMDYMLLANDAITAAVIAVSADAEIADAVLDEVVEGTYTLRQYMRLMTAALCSKVSGGGTVTVTFRDTGDTVNRIVATVDANGNRTAVVLNP